MKKIQLFGLMVLIALSSCKKNDIEAKSQAEQTNEVSNTSNAQLSNWITIQNWTTTGNNSQASIEDKNISSDVTKEGLVLVFTKSGATETALPGQVGNKYFYYQVENGTIQINSVAKEGSSAAQQQFSYIILSKDQLQKLEDKGVSKSQLMAMNSSQVKQLAN
jgi:hypothetical protein